jgi:hypothetical protein
VQRLKEYAQFQPDRFSLAEVNDRSADSCRSGESANEVPNQVVCIADDGTEQIQKVLELQRQELVMETLGMSLAEAKAVLQGTPEFVTQQQTLEFLEQERTCKQCAQL